MNCMYSPSLRKHNGPRRFMRAPCRVVLRARRSSPPAYSCPMPGFLRGAMVHASPHGAPRTNAPIYNLQSYTLFVFVFRWGGETKKARPLIWDFLCTIRPDLCCLFDCLLIARVCTMWGDLSKSKMSKNAQVGL